MGPAFSRALYYFCLAAWLLVTVNTFARPAFGYIDPGSGLLVFQIIGSTIAGMGFLLRRSLRQFFSRFGYFSHKGDASKRAQS